MEVPSRSGDCPKSARGGPGGSLAWFMSAKDCYAASQSSKEGSSPDEGGRKDWVKRRMTDVKILDQSMSGLMAAGTFLSPSVPLRSHPAEECVSIDRAGLSCRTSHSAILIEPKCHSSG